MQLTQFPTDKHYMRAQWRTSRRKKKNRPPYYPPHEIERIVDWIVLHWDAWKEVGSPVTSPLLGICHGARSGAEAADFESRLPGSAFLATDLFPKLYALKHDVIEHDFRREREDWVGAFDMLYSNSLDHSDNPRGTLSVWMRQLKSDGLLFLEWSWGHRETKGGDCFGASLDEYLAMLEQAGEVLDLIYIGSSVVVLVATPKKG